MLSAVAPALAQSIDSLNVAVTVALAPFAKLLLGGLTEDTVGAVVSVGCCGALPPPPPHPLNNRHATDTSRVILLTKHMVFI
jgi:hypothetical protein